MLDTCFFILWFIVKMPCIIQEQFIICLTCSCLMQGIFTIYHLFNLIKNSEADRALMEGPIKLHRALKNMSNNKSPGNDGLPKEFLLAFFDLKWARFIK